MKSFVMGKTHQDLLVCSVGYIFPLFELITSSRLIEKRNKPRNNNNEYKNTSFISEVKPI